MEKVGSVAHRAGEGHPRNGSLTRPEEGPAFRPHHRPHAGPGRREGSGGCRERPRAQALATAPPQPAQERSAPLPGWQLTGQGRRACRDLEPKLSRVLTRGTLASGGRQVEPTPASNSPEPARPALCLQTWDLCPHPSAVPEGSWGPRGKQTAVCTEYRLRFRA